MTQPLQGKDWRWPKLRDFIVDRIHGLVESEVQRTYELTSGAVRRDGGRVMNEEIVIRGIVESVDKYIQDTLTSFGEEVEREIEKLRIKEPRLGHERMLTDEEYSSLKTTNETLSQTKEAISKVLAKYK